MSEGSPPSHRTADEAVRRHRASHHPLLVGPVELPSPRAALLCAAYGCMATSHASTTELDFSLRQHANSTAHDDKPSGKPGRKPAGQVYEAGARSSRSNPALVRRGLLSVSPDRAYEGRTKPAFARRSLQPKWPTNVPGARLVPAALPAPSAPAPASAPHP